MPRLFLPNAENVMPQSESGFTDFFRHKTLKVFPRFICSLNPGDILVTPTDIDYDFQKYLCSLLGLGTPEKTIIKIKMAPSCLLTDSLKADSQALAVIKERCQIGHWEIEPYIQTESILELGHELGLPVRGTNKQNIALGLIDNLNSKDFCKALATGAGCRVPPGLCADSAESLAWAINKVAAELFPDSTNSEPELMLRKVKSAGGAGNLSGTPQYLQAQIKHWYGGGRVLVEPFLNFETVCGSLSLIDNEGSHFVGLDSQVFEPTGGWCGFDYPAVLPESSGDDIRSRLLSDIDRLSKAISAAGARGYLNMDWGLVRSQSGELMPVFLECNFRHNGLGYVLEAAKRICGDNWQSLYISSREALNTSIDSTNRLLDRLDSLNCEGEPLLLHKQGKGCGLIVTSPPARGHVAIAVLGPNEQYVESALALATAALQEP
ncbi:MAG: hypothetical protein ACI38Q_06200 [Candidatus Bruticola sp.]